MNVEISCGVNRQIREATADEKSLADLYEALRDIRVQSLCYEHKSSMVLLHAVVIIRAADNFSGALTEERRIGQGKDEKHAFQFSSEKLLKEYDIFNARLGKAFQAANDLIFAQSKNSLNTIAKADERKKS